MAKPEFLYRGSPTKNAEIFKPKEYVRLGGSEKLVVSATPDRAIATKFIVPIEKLKVMIGVHNGTHYYICAEEDKFRRLDKGGAIYTFEQTGFSQASELGPEVWVNPNPVKPVSKESVKSGLRAMTQEGVRVTFVTTEMFEELRKNIDLIETLMF